MLFFCVFKYLFAMQTGFKSMFTKLSYTADEISHVLVFLLSYIYIRLNGMKFSVTTS